MSNQYFWTDDLNPSTFSDIQEQRLAKMQIAIDTLLSVSDARTIENTLAPYDEALTYLDAAGEQSSLMQEVHPDADFRKAAEEIAQKVSAAATDLSLNAGVFRALSDLDLTGADDETRYYVEKTLRDFRLAGVDRDDETRARIKTLQDELVLTGQEFSRNIREDKSTITADSVVELDGLPADYIAAHQSGEDGKITLTTEYPDYVPVMTYAKSDDLRRRMYFAFNNRAYPQNMAVLDQLAAKRFELANLLGFDTWANFVTADKMIKTASNASNFIDQIVDASGDRCQREYDELLECRREDDPTAERIEPWQSTFYAETVRRKKYDFDSQAVRPYLPYKKVKDGVLDICGRLFGVSFKHIDDAPVWHPLVEFWAMYEGGNLVGRFYLDMHPREGKFSHAAQFGVQNGIRGRQIPEATLVCNFPGGTPGDDGLMQHNDVSTFFHEFGHLLHTLFGGHRKWIGVSGIKTEWDFVEAPSQLLEEWTKDVETLQSFAKHYQTGEAIPEQLIDQMNRADNFGKGLGVRRQMVFARISLSMYDRRPEQLDTDALVREVASKYSPFPTVDGTHFQTAFGHLDGYSAIYYTYMWSLVLAKDIFGRFDKNDLLETDIPRVYRQAVLDPGGSKPAAELVKGFLGRESNFAAWQSWLNEG